MAIGICRSRVFLLHEFPLIQRHILQCHLTLSFTVPRSSDHHESSYKCLLNVGEAEAIRNFRNGTTQPVGELHIIVSGICELGLPEVAILHSLFQIWIWEEELSVESARPLRDSGVQALKMVRGTHHENAVIRLQAIDFIEEEGAYSVRDEGIEVFKDKVAGRFLASLAEDCSEREFGRDEAVWSEVVSQLFDSQPRKDANVDKELYAYLARVLTNNVGTGGFRS